MQHSGSYGSSQVSLVGMVFGWSSFMIFFLGPLWFLILDLCTLCSLIDDGKNPDEFTKDVINSCIAKNQITKGKTDAFKVALHILTIYT